MSTDNALSLNGTATTWPEVLTLAEAAAFLKVSEEAVRVAIQRGELPGMRFGEEVRFSREALLQRLSKPLTFNNNALDMTPAETHERILALAGCWKDDPTIDAMIEEIYRERKRHLVGDYQ